VSGRCEAFGVTKIALRIHCHLETEPNSSYQGSQERKRRLLLPSTEKYIVRLLGKVPNKSWIRIIRKGEGRRCLITDSRTRLIEGMRMKRRGVQYSCSENGDRFGLVKP
jgi:hypothetical protein